MNHRAYNAIHTIAQVEEVTGEEEGTAGNLAVVNTDSMKLQNVRPISRLSRLVALCHEAGIPAELS